MSEKRYSSCLDLGKRMYLIVLTFSGSGEIPFLDILCPKNFSLVAPKTDLLSLFTFKRDFRILLNAFSMQMSSWFRVYPHMMISSWLFLSLSQPFIVSSISCWETSLALCM